MHLRSLLLVVLLLLEVSCRCKEQEPPPPPPPPQCFEDSDCPSMRFLYCNLDTRTCDPACKVREDCSAAERGELALPDCAGPLGCECDQGTCRVGVCSADAQCPTGQACRNGRCADVASLPVADACELYPAAHVVPAGRPFEVGLLATAQGAPVVPAQVSWTAGAPLPATGLAAQVTPAQPGALVVSAQTGNASCSTTVQVLSTGGLPAGEVLVVAFDAVDGEPVSGATVELTLDGVAGPVVGTTDATGAVRLSTADAGVAALSAFHAGHDWLTVVAPAARVIALPLSPGEPDAGFTGTFTNVPESNDVLVAAAGAGARFGPVDLSTRTLLGEPHAFDAGAVGTFSLVGRQLPSGVLFQGYKDDIFISAPGRPAAVWALMHPVGVFDILSLLMRLPVSEDVRDRYETELARLLLLGGHSTVVRDVTASPLTLVHGQQRLALAGTIRVGVLPKFRASTTTGALALAGVHVPGRGWVPLGFGSGVDDNRDSALDGFQVGGTSVSGGLLLWRAAPPHHGLEGWPMSVVVLARSSRARAAVDGSATSGAVVRLPREGVPFDPTGEAPLQLPRLPPFPDGASLDVPTRRFLMPAASIGDDATLVQVVFEGAEGRWRVVASPAAAGAGFSVPAAPTGFLDRLIGAKLKVQTLRLATDAGVLGFDEVVEWNETNLDRAPELTTGFGSMDSP